MSSAVPRSERSNPPKGNWDIHTRAASANLYALALVDLQNFDQPNFPSGVSTSFIFNMNPKSTQLEEPAAVVVTPTQDGSQFVEHQGQIYKNINISGTTGLRPNKARGAITPVLGGQLQPTGTESGLPRGETSGFENLLSLRNLFRSYWELKVNPKYAHRTVLVWQNGKEGDFYIVEPLTFRTSRDATSPLTFSYDIQLKTINRFDNVSTQIVSRDLAERRVSAVGAFRENLRDALQGLTLAFAFIEASVDKLVTFGQSVVSSVLLPLNNIIMHLTGAVRSTSRAFLIPKAQLAILAASLADLRREIDNADRAYSGSGGVTTDLSIVSNGAATAIRALASLASQDDLFSSNASADLAKKANAYRKRITGSLNSETDPTSLQNVPPIRGAEETVVGSDETIQQFAQRVLGDSSRWKEIVILNRLESPYISAAGDGTNVLRPGDKILFPSESANVRTGVSVGEDQTLATRLGTDLKISSSQSTGGFIAYDLSVSSKGDLETVSGLPNLKQSVVSRFSVEPGELPGHPGYGVRFPIGEKATPISFIQMQVNARSSILSDPRFSDISRLSLSFSGNTLNLDVSIDVAGGDAVLPLQVSVQR